MVIGLLQQDNHLQVRGIVADPINEAALGVLAGEWLKIDWPAIIHVHGFGFGPCAREKQGRYEKYPGHSGVLQDDRAKFLILIFYSGHQRPPAIGA